MLKLKCRENHTSYFTKTDMKKLGFKKGFIENIEPDAEGINPWNKNVYSLYLKEKILNILFLESEHYHFAFGEFLMMDIGGSEQLVEKHLRKAIDLNPYCPDTPFLLGILLNSQGRHIDALRFYQKAIELDPDNIQYKQALNECLEKTF